MCCVHAIWDVNGAYVTISLHDVHRETNEKLRRHRVPGAEFDEVTYADDTICITRDTGAMNEFVKNI